MFLICACAFHLSVFAGLGDSESWKVYGLPKYVYMFLAPYIIPFATPFVGKGIRFYLISCLLSL